MARYLAAIHQEGASAFGVSFHDFPGCIGAGRTIDLALRNAAEALAFHIEGLEEDGAEISQPSHPTVTVMAEDEDGRLGFASATSVTLNDALHGAVEAMEENPEACFADDDDMQDGLVGFYWVEPQRAEADRTVRLNITLPQSLVDAIDVRAGERGRSAFLAESARTALDGDGRTRAFVQHAGRKRKRAAG